MSSSVCTTSAFSMMHTVGQLMQDMYFKRGCLPRSQLCDPCVQSNAYDVQAVKPFSVLAELEASTEVMGADQSLTYANGDTAAIQLAGGNRDKDAASHQL